jgi:large subunit ribosomal protein L31
MKKDIHPAYHKCTVTCVSCGATFETGSTLTKSRLIPARTATPSTLANSAIVANDGRIDRFNKKLAKAQEKKA